MFDPIKQGLFPVLSGQPRAYALSHSVIIALALVFGHGCAQRIHLRAQCVGHFSGSELFEQRQQAFDHEIFALRT